MEFDRKAKVQSIIDAVKDMKELELEKTNFYTNLILIGYNSNFIDTEYKIDECLQNNQTVDIYELLNFNGLNEIIWKSKKDIENYTNSNSNINTGSTFASETETKKKSSDKNCFTSSNSALNNVGKNYQLNFEKDLNKNIISINDNKDDILPICYETLKNFRMPILDYNMENKDKKFEYLVEINHRFVTEKEYYLFNQGTFNQMHNFFFDAMLLNNSVF